MPKLLQFLLFLLLAAASVTTRIRTLPPCQSHDSKFKRGLINYSRVWQSHWQVPYHQQNNELGYAKEYRTINHGLLLSPRTITPAASGGIVNVN